MPRAFCCFRRSVLFFALISAFVLAAGTVASAQRVHLRAQLAPNCTSSAGDNLRYADIFADGNIAVQGSYGCKGVFIYDITNPDAPVLANWYNPGNNIQFLEAIVIGNRGYFGSGNGGGVHIVDLTNPYSPVLLGTVNATTASAHNSIHEMVVFDQDGARYLVENYNGLGTKTLKVINVTNPATPVFIRNLVPTEPQWVHAMVVRGNRLFTSGWGNTQSRGRTEIYDVANIATQAPTLLGYVEDTTSITAGNNMHSAWPSEDGNWLYSCRETNDGLGDVRVYNISNPATPIQVNRLSMQGLHLNAVTPHNPVVMGNYLFVAWYQAGIQIFNLSNPANPVRVGGYDTFAPAFHESPPQKRNLLETDPWDMVCGANFAQNNLPTNYDGAWAVYPYLGMKKVLAGDLQSGLVILDASAVSSVTRYPVGAIDPDGSVWAHITGLSVTVDPAELSVTANGGLSTNRYGSGGDVMVNGDYDGDGVADAAVYRPASGTWYIQGSRDGFRSVQFGLPTDVPVAADYDSDGRTDIAVWRPSTGVWYVQQSILGFKAVQWGAAGDRVLTGDYDGDGKADMTAWRPADGTWYVLPSASSIPIYRQFGQAGDQPVNADFDGNGVSDFAVYRSGTWYAMDANGTDVTAYNFGLAGDVALPADYDGDGHSDLTVFRPGTGHWYSQSSSTGEFTSRPLGQPAE